MSKEKNFLEQINEEKKVKEKPLESFKAESYVKAKEKVKIIPYVTIIILALIAVGAYYFFSQEDIIIVDFTGMELEAVSSWSELNGVMLLSKGSYDNNNDEGIVIKQNLEAGYSLNPEDTLSIIVSQGPDPYELIELADFDSSWSKSSVAAWLKSNKVSNFAFKYIEDLDVDGDYLINYIITGAKQEDYSRSASLEFVFSQAEEAATIVMPNYLGDSLSSFATWAVGEGFNYTYTESYSNIYSEGQIMTQNFAPDMERLITNDLKVVVSLGASTDSIIMGNLVNMSISEGMSWLIENGLNMSMVKQYNNDFAEDKIIEQNIDVGVEVLKGTTVELKISVGEAVLVPNFADYTYQNYSLAIESYNGFVLVNQRYDEDILVNQFISQSITHGRINDGEEPIEVIYSLGSNMIIPDFRGDTLEEVHEWVSNQNDVGASIALNIIEDIELNEDYGVIFKQNYYNKNISMNETIEVVVSTKKVVPDFSIITLEEALIYEETCGYSIVFEEKYQMYTDYEDFIWQSVTPGSEVDINTIVHVQYSLGMFVIIDDYRELPLSNLERTLIEYDKQGMTIRLVVNEYYNDIIPAGNIISQNIFNSSIGTGDKLEVIVSLGESYDVQNFVGYARSSVEAIAEDLGLNIVFRVEESTSYTGTVLSQSIDDGTTISISEFIYLTIAE